MKIFNFFSQNLFKIFLLSIFLIFSCGKNNDIDGIKYMLQIISDKVKNNEKLLKVDEAIFIQFDDNYLFTFYHQIFEKRNESFLYAKIAFEVKDIIIRRYSSLNDREKKISIFNKLQFIKNNSFNKSAFYNLKCTIECNGELYLNNSKIQKENYFHKSNNKIVVLHISFEAPNARVGGIAEYLTGLTKAEKINNFNKSENIFEGRLLTPFYDFLKVKYLEKVNFIGFVPSYIDGKIVMSSIYQLEENKIVQYFIQPDFNYSNNKDKKGWEIFDVEEQAKLYHIAGSNDGWVYFSTASASFSVLYHGLNNDDNIDIIHVNGRNLALVNSLIIQKFNIKRNALGIKKIGIISTLHDTNETKLSISSQFYKRSGLLSKEKIKEVNLLIELIKNSNVVNIVSKTMMNETIKNKFWKNNEIAELLKMMKNNNLYIGINNGIFFDNYDVKSNLVLGKLSVEEDYSNYESKKREAKIMLFNKRIIGSNKKPLYLFVGRFVVEKGLDVLVSFAKDIVLNKGGQIVIMGNYGGKIIPQIIKELINISKDPIYHNLIKIYTNYENDQLEIMSESGVSKGKIIRFASDFTIVPSIQEAAGLVPIEALSMGSIVISSYLQGLKDQCTKPYGYLNSTNIINDINNFTCVPFERVENNSNLTFDNMNQSITHFLNEWNKLNQKEKTRIQIKLIQEAKSFDWNAKGGSLEQYIQEYKKINNLIEN